MTTFIRQLVLEIKSRWRPRPISQLARRQAQTGLLFIAPWVIGFLLLKLGPIVGFLVFSFTDFDMLHPEAVRFIGLANYASILHDEGAGFTLMALTFGSERVCNPRLWPHKWRNPAQNGGYKPPPS